VIRTRIRESGRIESGLFNYGSSRSTEKKEDPTCTDAQDASRMIIKLRF